MHASAEKRNLPLGPQNLSWLTDLATLHVKSPEDVAPFYYQNDATNYVDRTSACLGLDDGFRSSGVFSLLLQINSDFRL